MVTQVVAIRCASFSNSQFYFKSQNKQNPKCTIYKNLNIPSLALVDTGQPAESTGDMVKHLEQLLTEQKSLTTQKLTNIGQLTKQLLDQLTSQTAQPLAPAPSNQPQQKSKVLINQSKVTDIINQLGTTLESLGAVDQQAIKFSQQVRQIGGAAKISGGGGRTNGSGLMIVYGITSQQLSPLLDQFGYSIAIQL